MNTYVAAASHLWPLAAESMFECVCYEMRGVATRHELVTGKQSRIGVPAGLLIATF